MRNRIVLAFLVFMAWSVKPAVFAQSSGFEGYLPQITKNINGLLKDGSTGLYFETTDVVQKDNPHSWLWPLCALVQAANEMDALSGKREQLKPVVKAIDQYYSEKQPLAYQDYVTAERLSSRFYDDNQWIAIAYLDAYNRTKEAPYLNKAIMVYDYMITGIDAKAGGGLYWKEGDFSTKNTCSNAPAILVALQLYKITKEKKYLETALSVYDWTNKTLRSPEGLFYDAIKIPGGEIDRKFYTYNAGAMLQANALLFTITSNKKYLIEAQQISKAAKNYFFKDNRLPGHYWFNAVLLRGGIELYKIDKNSDWINIFRNEAQRIWSEERDDANLIGQHKEKSLIDQAAMLEIYARLIQLEKQK
ncbi:glycoside hydrolase family 88 protein [Pedobacter sp. PLR]|uniref:glycoside hydrolase family 76 protein n=1 Tax=Pedobacter sp. PLR TaxID=2994465 RepID=UPI002246C0BB|nr:glycoside hydrolase family 76 protein [Pedobacter sp. PLR]MCX2452064.1 glycoside hydrolase family 88 protein [Pedobacter sp. PLR]